MTTSLSQNYNPVQGQSQEKNHERLIEKLYQLKEKFESKYYGKVECRNYDRARAFAIQLSATLFQANQIQSATRLSRPSTPPSTNIENGQASIFNSEQIRIKFKSLKQELDEIVL